MHLGDHEGDAGLGGGGHHCLAFGHRTGHRLLDKNVLAGFGGGDGDLGVEIVRETDVDGVDPGIFDDRAVIGRDLLCFQLETTALSEFGRDVSSRDDPRDIRSEGFIGAGVGVGNIPAADQAHAQRRC